MTPITTKSIGLDGDVFPDRRKETRRRVLKGGRISFNSGFSVFECVVKNTSPNGARLELGDTSAIPSRFELLVAGDDVKRSVAVRWREMTVLGVSLD
jgi:hypothetical protein